MYGCTSPDGDTGPSQDTRDFRGHKQTVPNLGQQRAVKGDPEVGNAERMKAIFLYPNLSPSLPPSPTSLSQTRTSMKNEFQFSSLRITLFEKS